MSYKYFYRIKFERATDNGGWAVGSIMEQFRNKPLTSREFKHIRQRIFDEMDGFAVNEVRACIYRISAFDDCRIGEFNGTENYDNHDYDSICDCYVPLVAIFHITAFISCTQYGWYECGTPYKSHFHFHIAHKPIEGGANDACY